MSQPNFSLHPGRLAAPTRFSRQGWHWLLATPGLAGLMIIVWIGVQQLSGFNAHDTAPDAGFTPRRALALTWWQDRLYATGGWNGASPQLSAVEILDPARGAWTTGPALNVARSQHAALAAGDRLWVLGGWSAQAGLVSAVEALSPGASRWEIVTHLPTPRREPGAALLGDWVVVAGGFNGRSDADVDGYLTTVEAYDPRTGQWQRLASLNTPRRGLALVASGGALYALGGYNAEDGFLNTVERYDPQSGRWTALDWPILPRTWAASAILNGDILLLGGYNLQGYLAAVERIDPTRGEVCLAQPLNQGRAWLAAAPLDGGLLAIGGEGRLGIDRWAQQLNSACSQ